MWVCVRIHQRLHVLCEIWLFNAYKIIMSIFFRATTESVSGFVSSAVLGTVGTLMIRGVFVSQMWSTGAAASCFWGCFSAGGTGALHNINPILTQDNDMEILKHHLKTSVKKLKHGCKWLLQRDNDLQMSYTVAEGQQRQGTGLANTKPWSHSNRRSVCSAEKACANKNA